MATDVITSSLDLRRMVQEAEAAGFNPLTVLRNGGAAGFATQSTTYEAGVGSGQFTSQPAASPVAPAMPEGGVYGGPGVINFGAEDAYFSEKSGWGSLSGSSVSNERPGPWELESELNIAVHQLRQRTGALVTDDGKYVATRGAVGGSLFNPVSYTAPGGAAPRPVGAGAAAVPVKGKGKSGKGFQPDQVYQTDKIPNVIENTTTHWILPDVPWYEVGGTSRGETGETIYGDDSPGAAMFGVPKFLNDFGYTLQRWVIDAGQPMRQSVQSYNPAPDASFWGPDTPFSTGTRQW